MNKNSFRVFLLLALIGVVFSLASLVLPYAGFDPNRISAAGQISSAFAGIFGLFVAALALQSYVWSESTEKNDIDLIWSSVQAMQKEIFYSSLINTAIQKDMVKMKTEAEQEEMKELLLCEALKSLNLAFESSFNPVFAAWIESQDNGEDLKLAFNRTKLGLKISEINGWKPNGIINEHIVEIVHFINPITYKRVRYTYINK